MKACCLLSSEISGLRGRNRETRERQSTSKHHSPLPLMRHVQQPHCSRPQAPRLKTALAPIARNLVWMFYENNERLKEKPKVNFKIRSRCFYSTWQRHDVATSHGLMDFRLDLSHQHSYRV